MSITAQEAAVVETASMEKRRSDENQSQFETDDETGRDPDAGLTEEEKAEADRKLLKKLDWTLMPWLCFLYLISFLDRTNIGNAKVAHLTKDVPMTPTMFNHTLTVFFVAYALFEAVANVLLKRFRPSIFIPTIMILWGACTVGMGFVTNWSGLMAARFFLGVTEAGLFPGVNYYLSCWYRRKEFGVRAAVFFASAAIAGSFGGLLASGIQKMDGVGGHPGWAWIFILEGLLTILAGIASFWLVHDFPAEAKFLSSDEKLRVMRRLRLDKQSSASQEDFSFRYVWQAFSDWKTYLGMLIYMGPLMPLYSFSIFLPTIIGTLGLTKSVVKIQLLSVPPYIGAALLTIALGYLSDKSRRRGLFNMCIAPIGIIGFVILMTSSNPRVQYAGTFLAAMGIYPSIPITIAWMANNIEGVYKRGIVMGLVIGWGNLNGIVSSNVFINGPRFWAGYGTVIGYLAIGSFLGSVIMYLSLGAENRKRQAGRRDHWIQGLGEQEIAVLGDQRPDFIYTV